MKVLKIKYYTYKDNQHYVIINGKINHATYNFPVNISCKELDDETYQIDYNYTRYANADKVGLNYDYTLETINKSLIISDGEEVNGSYVNKRWEYVKGMLRQGDRKPLITISIVLAILLMIAVMIYSAVG